MSIETQLADNTAALKTVADLLAKFLANDHVPAAKALAAQHAPKVAKPVAEAPKAEVAKAEPAPAAAPSPSNEDAYTEVKRELLKLIAAKGSDAGKAVLTQFGVSNGKQLSADKYPEVLAAIATALKAA